MKKSLYKKHQRVVLAAHAFSGYAEEFGVTPNMTYVLTKRMPDHEGLILWESFSSLTGPIDIFEYDMNLDESFYCTTPKFKLGSWVTLLPSFYDEHDYPVVWQVLKVENDPTSCGTNSFVYMGDKSRGWVPEYALEARPKHNSSLLRAIREEQ